MRSKKERIDDALTKIKEVADEMKFSTDINNVVRTVRISKYFSIELNSIRDDTDEFSSYGKHLYFEVYAIIDGKAVDCMTIDTFRDFDSDVMYLLPK